MFWKLIEFIRFFIIATRISMLSTYFVVIYLVLIFFLISSFLLSLPLFLINCVYFVCNCCYLLNVNRRTKRQKLNKNYKEDFVLKLMTKAFKNTFFVTFLFFGFNFLWLFHIFF